MALYLRPAFFLLFQSSIHAQYESDDDNDDDSTDSDTCTFISGQSCTSNGICKYCAMCLQSSCILSKATTANDTLAQDSGICNTTALGETDTYSWYNYCLSSGEDNSGDYCATSTECYQYRKNPNPSVSYAWQNLTCNPTSCMLVTDSGQPAPMPGQLPTANTNASSGIPEKAGSDTPSSHNGHHSGHHNDKNSLFRSPAAIALTVTCSFVFVVCLIWLMRLWFQSRFWPPCRRVQSPQTSTPTPSVAPPSFTSTPEMAQAGQTGAWHQVNRSNSHQSSTLSSSSQYQEPLPSYFSPDPPPPKYEHAIVTQIRGLLDDSGEGASSSSNDMTSEHNRGMPPPMWLPVYFTPNQSSFSFGRLRRHPPSLAGPSGATSSATNSEWADPVRSFWHNHQQQLQNQNPQMWQTLVNSDVTSSSGTDDNAAPAQPEQQNEAQERRDAHVGGSEQT